MKNSRILCASALVSVVVAGHAFAQSAVTVYGIIDTGVVYTSNANANGNSVMKMPSLTGTFPSRIGFKGVEDLGSGLQTIFVAETGFAPDTGAMGQGNRIFGRQSYVGLKGAWGQIMLGRQVNMTYLAPLKSDVMGPNIFSIGSIDGYLPNARSDNAIGYLGTFGSFTAGATYSFGRDGAGTGGPAATNCPGEVAGNAKACRQFTGLLAYETKAYGINTSYDILYGNAGAAGGLTSSDNYEQRVTVNGYWMLGDIKVGGGIVDHRIRAASNLYKDSDLYYLGMSYPFSAALVLDAQLARLNTKGSSNDVTLSVARLIYVTARRSQLHPASSSGRDETNFLSVFFAV